jgi:hypothetical protein
VATQNPRRLELGEMLRGLRETAGMKPAAVEQELGWYAGKLYRVENGTRVAVKTEIERLADLYQAGKADRATLILLADAARKREAPSRLPDFAQTYVTYERAAAEIRYYDGYLVPALLQTERYARAVLTTSRSAQVEARVADRIARRAVLTREDPPSLRVLLGEAVLHQAVAGEDALAEQLQHLLDVGQLPNVAIRIVPFSAGAHRMLGVGVTYLRLVSPEITRVYIEGLTDATYIHERDEVAVYEAGFEDVWSAAMDESHSATILRRHIGIE